MTEGLKGRFKDFAENVSFNDYDDFVEHLADFSDKTHTGSVQCNGCKKSTSISSQRGRVDSLNYGHAIVYCDTCKKELYEEFKPTEVTA